MKKYKLIKEYPGSPKLGFIIEFTKTGYLYKPGLSINENILKNKNFEDYPEFWQEVIEKDYEILQFRSLESFKQGLIIEVYNNLDKYLNSQSWEIYSVKRLSDGEIFTIGDKVYHTNNVLFKEGIIIKFHILSNGIWFKTDKFDVPIIFIENKSKKPLFKTEDGVDVFEGDDIYSIDDVLNIKKHRLFNARYDDKTLLNNRLFFNSDYKHFSTKEKAEEYILMNKPCLSVNDFDKLTLGGPFNETIDRLKKLVKLRIE